MILSFTPSLKTLSQQNPRVHGWRPVDSLRAPHSWPGIEADPDHLEALRETESNTVKCVPDYRNRLKHVIKFWKEHYREYYDEVIVRI